MTLHSLPLFVRLAGRPVILLGEGEAADAKRRLLERAGARIVGEEADASLAIVALEDEAAATAAVARLKARGVLVNAVDRPALCDFTLPAIIDRAPVIVAIGTGGVSAGLAGALRQRLEAMLPAALGRLAEALHGARADLRARWPDSGDRRRALGAALNGGPLDPLTAAPEAVAAWLGGSEAPEARRVVITLRSDDPDDLTLREARWLGQADVVSFAADVPVALLDRARADAVRVEGQPQVVEGLHVHLRR
ncbi:precorrin-2 dehydrogenase/sirohydrochlorin ferrochelatase family protein [Sphingomonas aracearum]|uniref:precorrin-2 dehydrogenase n=1 Tax=Sphingomonas aracearum TaxID=2283317 RepID=A0A369VZX0_9SPHN|nr:bifunctional precorrin-2 dehydrogenase/sirohydrochlorin ferrochelatase [Sphingomonas aracearum]RDE07197.1 siroheme synthase [Sphingomonas aracearum]